MHLHVSFNDLQPSSVGESFREEFKTAVYAESWMQGADSRCAIWQAGQIVRAAEAMDRGTLCDVYSIALLQAAVVLFVAGSFSCRRHTQTPAVHTSATTSIPATELQDVSLNTSHTPVLKRVIEGNWQPDLPPWGTDEVIRVLDDLCAVFTCL
jgi:hypothetical protein